MKRIFKLLFVIMCVIALVGCSKEKLSDLDKVINALDECSVQYTEGDTKEKITGNITLKNSDDEGVTIAWSSSAEAIISKTGVVTKPTTDTKVTLTVTVTVGTEKLTKSFEVNVKGTGSDIPDPTGDYTLTSITEINTIAAGLADKESTAVPYTVSGIITEVKNETYGNVMIKDANNNELYIYGLYDGEIRYDAMTYKPIVGDTIVVTGPVKNYGGVAEISNGIILEIIKGSGSNPTDPTDPTGDYTLTSITEINTIGTGLADKEATTDVYYVSGTISEVKNETYGNVMIKDTNNNELYIYGLYDGEIRYDAMTYKPTVGDTIVVCGPIKNYSGTIEIINATLIKLTKGGGSETPDPIDPPATATTIAQIHGGSSDTVSAKIEGATIVQTYVRGFLAKDDTGSIVVYLGDTEFTYAIGDVITIEGTTSAYNGLRQFTNTATITKTSTTTYTAPATTEYKATEIDAYIAADTKEVGKYVSITGVLVTVGSNYNINVDGTSIVVALTYALDSFELASYVDSNITITGYTIGVSSDNARINIMCASVETATPVDCTLTINNDAITLNTAETSVLSGTSVEVTVAVPEGKVATLKVNDNIVILTNNKASVKILKNTTFDVNFSDPISSVTFDFVSKFSTYGSEWSNQYSERTITSTDLGVTSLPATIVLSNGAWQQSNAIDDRPVLASKGINQYITITTDFSNFSTVTFDLKQWNTKTFKEIYLEYTTDGTTWTKCSTTTTVPVLLVSNVSITGAKAVRLVAIGSSTSSNTQLGLSSIALS